MREDEGVAEFLDSGGLIFTAAGNDNDTTPSYLGAYNDNRVLAVAATQAHGETIVRDAAGRLPVFFEVRALTFGAVTASMIASPIGPR